jgi:hypothetical protein
VLQRFADIFPAGLRLHKRSRAKPLLP